MFSARRRSTKSCSKTVINISYEIKKKNKPVDCDKFDFPFCKDPTTVVPRLLTDSKDRTIELSESSLPSFSESVELSSEEEIDESVKDSSDF
jgi:hypothetical protein